MKLDYNERNNQLILEEEDGENFLSLHDDCGFVLYPRLRGNKYQIPFMTLPIIMRSLKKLNYGIKFSQLLKDYYNRYNTHRNYLSELKDRCYKHDDKRVHHILAYIRKIENDINKRMKLKGGKPFSFYSNQVETIVYGIIGERIIIGNDIGTGKSLTSLVIAKYLMEYKDVKNVLIMLPASLVKNFYNDYMKFFEDNQMLMISDQVKKKREILYNTFKASSSFKILITNYEKCLFDEKFLRQQKFECIIVDEFHKMRNFISAKRSINFFDMISNTWKPRYRYPMSGTPIENRLFDIYPIFKLLDDGKILGGQRFFEHNFVEYSERTIFIKLPHMNRCIEKVEKKAIGFKNHNFVKNLIKPYIIKKKLDLPVDCYRNEVIITPSAKLLESYTTVKQNAVSGTAKYMAARQFLCDTHRNGFMDNPKDEELENIVSQTSSKVLIFSFFKCSMEAVGRKLKSMGYKYLTCMGGDGKDPFDVVRQFESDPSIKALITTDKINFGHNIQCAKIVIEWEKPLKPTTTMQRIGRAYRSGQTEDVHVYSFTINHTIEEIIHEEWLNKKDVIDRVIESMGTESTDETLGDIIKDVQKSIQDNVLRKFAKEK